MWLEINIWDKRTYTKILPASIQYSNWIATIVILNTHNSLETPTTDDVFTFEIDHKPTVEEAYGLIKTLPEFEWYYNC